MLLEELWRKLEPILVGTVTLLVHIAQNYVASEAIMKSGWLPHYTSPWDEVLGLTDEQMFVYLSTHYKENWDVISVQIITRSEEYNVDKNARDVLSQAVSLHKLGYYQAVCRLVFPEIERLEREYFSIGKLVGLANSPQIVEGAGTLPLD